MFSYMCCIYVSVVCCFYGLWRLEVNINYGRKMCLGSYFIYIVWIF